MVLPVSGFLPVPLPMMIPFMGAQSLVIGKMFGEGFQYGKRKISAMSNEQFNKLTFQDMMSNARTELQASIPTMQAALHDMQPLVETVINEFFDYIKIFAERVPEATRLLTGGGEFDFSGKTGGFNLSPEDIAALAKTGQQTIGTQVLGDTVQPSRISTVPGLTVQEAQQRARQQQISFGRQQLLAKEAHARLVRGRTVIAPSGPTASVRSQQRAGQSQKMERLKLIKEISNAGKTLVHLKELQRRGVLRGSDVAQLQRLPNVLRMLQQKLVNLLARYVF